MSNSKKVVQKFIDRNREQAEKPNPLTQNPKKKNDDDRKSKK